MAQTGWITPNPVTSGGKFCRRFLVPLDISWLSPIMGALVPLTYAWNWEQVDGITPDEAAEAYAKIYNDIVTSDGKGCRMIGEIIWYGSTTNPDADHWLYCDGTSLLRADYPDLFAVIGTSFGAVDGTHFNIPDLRGRVMMGAGTGSGLSTRSIGDEIGEETNTLTTGEIPAHSHIDTGHTHSEGTATPTLIAIGAGVPAASAIPTVGITGVGSANIADTGGGGSHNNIQPSLVIGAYIYVSD